MFTGPVGGWLELAAYLGFILVNAAGLFAALWWALGRPDEPSPPATADRGRMTAAGLPYVPGSVR